MNKKRNLILILVVAILGISIPIYFVFADGGYKKTPKGLQYRIIKDNGQRKAAINDIMMVNITYKTDKDSVILSSRALNANKPIEMPVSKPQFNGDPAEAYVFVGAGDSVEFKIPNDSIFKGQQMPGFAKPGGYLHLYMQIISVLTKQEYDANKKAEEAKQQVIDDALIVKYLKDNNLAGYQKTASGLYYKLDKEGTGQKVEKGLTANVNYTGKVIDGTKFDSSTDSTFHHVQPLQVKVGMGNVIPGWDEGLQLFNVGTKGTLIIPSGLAYKGNARGPIIKANSILIFDMEVVGVEASEDKKLSDFISSKGWKAERTPSGLYIVVDNPGTGKSLEKGKNVTMNYTGSLLNGTKFDSNVDPTFGHVQPFTFKLGAGQVIRGWDEGVPHFKVGGKGKLIIPSELGYGQQSQAKIPAGSALIFDIEVVNAE